MNRCNATHAVVWTTHKYEVVANVNELPRPNGANVERGRTPSGFSLRGERAFVKAAPPTIRDNHQNVIVGDKTISHARFGESTVVNCDVLWTVGNDECHRHGSTSTTAVPDCHGVVCLFNKTLVVAGRSIYFDGTSVAIEGVVDLVHSVGAVVSGNDVFVANGTCVAGIMSQLFACVLIPHWNTVAVASFNSTVYILDGPTGDVLAFRHYEAYNVTLGALVLHARANSSGTSNVPNSTVINNTVTPARQMRYRPSVMLTPTMAVQRLDYGSATTLAIVNNMVERTFAAGTVVVSPIDVPSANGVYGEYVPERLCAPAEAEACLWYMYGTVEMCRARTSLLCPMVRIDPSQDNQCKTSLTPASVDWGHNTCALAAGCESGWNRTREGRITDTCCPIAKQCDGEYDRTINTCFAPPPATTSSPTQACTRRNYVPDDPGANITNTSTPCPDGFYGPACVPCSSCRAGQRMVTPCGDENTLCGDCPKGTYMDLHAHTFRHCKPGNGCPGVTSTHDGDCTVDPALDVPWWSLALPLYGCGVHAIMIYRKTFV